MNNSNLRKLGGALLLTSLLAVSPLATAQTSVSTSTTTTAGTISEFSPTSNTIIVRSETSPEPISYTYSKSTTYVDETGAPVSMETVKSGLPVTVHYVKEGDRMIANRVIVRRSTTTTGGAAVSTTTTAPAAAVIEKRTTTTAPAPAVIEERKTTTTTTESK
jgi:hypothetical protein